MDGSPNGTSASIGDSTYYTPWGTLAIFYKDFGFQDAPRRPRGGGTMGSQSVGKVF
ncbi:cyclophilin-like fold protein [Tumebacillus permanentifrigoris]|uniref:cyclophilin-like fold protein n=1 Tax=Tumebacillus permanentifrigoris TaxID=378543 RepID=UPI001474C54A|nr:cyclophilin-like fold protein [Tumebacillus permanentifrigoris]